MAKVFVVQENNKIDYSDAERFGDLVFLTVDEWKGVKNSLRDKNILEQVRTKISAFDPATDYLLLTGNPIIIGYAFHEVMARSDTASCLQWDRFTNSYRAVVFTKPD